MPYRGRKGKRSEYANVMTAEATGGGAVRRGRMEDGNASGFTGRTSLFKVHATCYFTQEIKMTKNLSFKI